MFSGLKGAVINTDSEILNLAENTVMFPTMDAEELTLSEELFLKELDGRFKAAFKTEEAEQQEKERFQKVIRLHGGNAVDDILNLLKQLRNIHLEMGMKNILLINLRMKAAIA